MSRPLASLLTILALTLVAPPVRGEPRWADRPFAVHGHVGLGTHLGLIGITAEVTPVDWVSVGAGAGASYGGPVFAGLARGRLPLWSTGGGWLGAITAEAAYSGGGSHTVDTNSD